MWQSGISNSAQVGQIFGLLVNAYCQDKIGSRRTFLIFMVWMAAFITIPTFATSLSMLAAGEALCGISWGVFQVSFNPASRLCWLCVLTGANKHTQRLFPPAMPVKSFRRSCDPTSPLSFACAGEQASSSRRLWFAPYLGSKATWDGGYHSYYNGFGRCPCLLAHGSLLNRLGTRSVVAS